MTEALAEKIEFAPKTEALENSEFYQDVIQGLSQAQKILSPKYFYDDLGSQYFDQICELEEYYPYKVELNLLSHVVSDVSEMLLKPVSIVEFGAGSLLKIRPLLKALISPCEFIPIDISGEHLRQASVSLQKEFPDLLIQPKEADFCKPVALPKFRGHRLGFFPGSTIGNLTPSEAKAFLVSARETLGGGAYMLIGVDTKKSPNVLHSAYNDKEGVTAKFNLNVLSRINKELDADFKPKYFDHYAFYNAVKGRVEMHLVSQKNQKINIHQAVIDFREGESIHTECSYKYTPDDFIELAGKSGWKVESTWLADKKMFSMFLLKNEN